VTAQPTSVKPASLLSIRGVSLQYTTSDRVILATYKVDFDVFQADRFVLLGPSGCGKSTLLKAVAGFHAPSEGEIRLHDKVVTKPGPDRMMIFQEFDQLLPWKTVRQNVMFPLMEAGNLRRKEATERADHYLAKVHLTKFADSFPHMLSGGMKQRVAIARGMAMEPDILLMDEPFAALDALTRRKMQDEVLELWDETRFTVMFVTHSIAEAIRIGNRIVLMSPHPGQVRAELNGLPRAEVNSARAKDLEAYIHQMLFAEQVEMTHSAA
jgi:NitT/TauT family transport system ATP-binding protein